MIKPVKKNDAPGAVDLVEEAIHLLRAAPPAAWAAYLAGAAPWVLALGYFWAKASWFAPRPAELLWHALGLAGLYVWLKVAQAEFCGRLRAVRMGAEAPALSWRRLARVAGRQARVQGWAAPLLPVASLIVLPFAATWMFFENATALAASPDPAGESLEGRARREAMRWPGPAHLALLLFSGVWLCAWLNIASAFYVVPWLARTLLGAENMFGLSGWSVLNSTWLALVTILTWLAVDPLVKAYHVLRTFYGEARLTGEDLRLELRRPSRGAAARAAWVAVVLCCAAGAGPWSLPLNAAGEPARATPAQVDHALDEALSGRDFRWSLQPLPSAAEAATEEGWVKGFVREGLRLIVQIVRDVRDLLKSIGDWFDGLFKSDKDKEVPKPKEAVAGSGAFPRGLLYAMLALCAAALAWILWTSWKKRPVAPRMLSSLEAAPAAPDLNDEKLEASRLPSQEWLALAREQLARGEWRLALRALYLGSLASLGARGLVSLARAKTNLDYERELARRAAGRADVIEVFRSRRLSFECVWYGRAAADEARVRAWLAELEREEGGPA